MWVCVEQVGSLSYVIDCAYGIAYSRNIVELDVLERVDVILREGGSNRYSIFENNQSLIIFGLIVWISKKGLKKKDFPHWKSKVITIPIIHHNIFCPPPSFVDHWIYVINEGVTFYQSPENRCRRGVNSLAAKVRSK